MFSESRFSGLVTSSSAIDDSQNLCCAHALLGGVGSVPDIVDLYGSLVDRLRILGTSAGAPERLRLASHVRDIPPTDVCLRRAQQMQRSLETFQKFGHAPGLSSGEQLSDSSYLGSYLDHIALFSSPWSQQRCHVVVESMGAGMVNVQKWESIDALGSDGAMHHSLSYEELWSLIRTYGSRLTCATLDHGTGGLGSTYHHYAQSHRLIGQSSALLRVFRSKLTSAGLCYALRQVFVERWTPTDTKMQRTGFGGYVAAGDYFKPSAPTVQTELPIPDADVKRMDGESCARILFYRSVVDTHTYTHARTHAQMTSRNWDARRNRRNLPFSLTVCRRRKLHL